MARYRKIDTRIWNDEKFLALPDDGKLCFLFILTHPHLTSLGAMRATRAGLAEELKWSAARFGRAFTRLEHSGMVRFDASTCLLWLPKFLRYNQPESPNVVRGWTKALDLLPECPMRDEVVATARGFAEGLGEAFAQAFGQGFDKASPNQEQEPNPEPQQEPEPTHTGVAARGTAWRSTIGKPVRAFLHQEFVDTLTAAGHANADAILRKWYATVDEEQTALRRATSQVDSREPVPFWRGMFALRWPSGDQHSAAEVRQQRQIEATRRAMELTKQAMGTDEWSVTA